MTVTGHVNGKLFSITRTKTPKKSGLAFILDGENITTQSVTETMLVIEEKLGVSAPILARTMFHGQHALNELLEATDAKFKEELSLTVRLELWQAAATLARTKGREATKKQNELEGMVNLRTDDTEKFKERCLKAAADMNARELVLRSKEGELEDHKLQRPAENMDAGMERETLDVLRKRIGEATAHMDAMQAKLRSLAAERTATLHDMSMQLSVQRQVAKEASENHQQIQIHFQSSTHELEALQSRVGSLESLWQVDLSSGELPVDFTIPDTCPTCLQPVSKVNNDISPTHDHHNLQEKTEAEIKEALLGLNSAQTRLSLSQSKLELASLQQKECDERVLEVEKELKHTTVHWDEEVSQAEKELSEYQLQVAELTTAFASSRQRVQSRVWNRN